MSEHSYKMIELVGSSHTSIEGAIQNAVTKAEQEEKSLRWFKSRRFADTSREVGSPTGRSV